MICLFVTIPYCVESIAYSIFIWWIRCGGCGSHPGVDPLYELLATKGTQTPWGGNVSLMYHWWCDIAAMHHPWWYTLYVYGALFWDLPPHISLSFGVWETWHVRHIDFCHHNLSPFCPVGRHSTKGHTRWSLLQMGCTEDNHSLIWTNWPPSLLQFNIIVLLLLFWYVPDISVTHTASDVAIAMNCNHCITVKQAIW